MDLLNLAAKIELDDSSYNRGINKAEKAGQGLYKKMSSMTVAIGNLAADMVRKGVSAITSIYTGAINGFADYEQLIGGVETLFKGSADTVANYAKQSFRTTGLSANEYMETVTSFSAALIQGLQGDVEAAADVANVAVTDMADNANKMGTDMSSIQAAYQGFAKQNFTMLDNLKLGYGGTREEMIRLINDSGTLNEEITSLDGITLDQIIAAIHAVQTELGITGTTAKEAAETISGSKRSMKAAWEDMLSAVGGEGGQDRLDETLENFKTSFSTYMENLLPTLVTTITNSGSLVEAVADSIAALPTTLLGEIGKKGMESGADMVRGVGTVTNWLIDSLISAFDSAAWDNTAATDLGNAIGEFLGNAIGKITTNAGTILSGAINLGIGLASGLVDGLMAGLFGPDGLPEQMQHIDDEMTDSIKEATQSATKAQGILDFMDELAAKYGDAAKETEEYKNAMAQLSGVMEIPDWITNTNQGLQEQIDLLRQSAEEMEKQAVAAAKQKALQDKEQAMIDAQAALWQAQSDININKSIRDEAAKNLLEFFGLKGATSSVTGEAIDQGFDYSANAAQIYESLIRRVDEATGGAGNQAYQDMMDKLSDPQNKGQVMAWISAMSESNQTMSTLEGTVSSLESQLQKAASDYALSSAAIDELAAAASGAASALSSIPSVNMNSGEYAAWFYGGGTPKASGMDYVPFNGFRAELHRGEAVLTRAQADNYRNGGGSAEVVGAIQRLGNDIRSIELVVGQKTFGRAVATYGGGRVRDSIGKAESRRSSGYGT